MALAHIPEKKRLAWRGVQFVAEQVIESYINQLILNFLINHYGIAIPAIVAMIL